MELADAITILVKVSAIDPSKIILRALFEALLYIKFITSERSEDRSKAYLVSYIRAKKIEYSRFKSGTQINQEFRKKIERDQLVEDGLNPFSKEIDELLEPKLKNLEEWISNPIFAETIKEFNRLKKKYDRKPFWYSLYGGSENIEKLADKLKYSYLYELLYRKWSEMVHGSDLITGNIAGDKSFYSIRKGFDANQVGSFSISIIVSCYSMLMEFTVPEMLPNLRTWYTKEIRTALIKINHTKIKIVA